MINGITFDERYQKALVHGSFNQSVLSDGILNGCTISKANDSMTIGVGSMIIGGRLIYFQATETTNIVSPTGNYVRFYFKIDLTQTPDSTTFSQGTIEYDYSSTLGGFAALTKEDINEDGNTYECEIAVYSLSGGNIDALIRSIGNACVKIDGWIPVADWVYASATTITVPSGAAALYTVGDKFKLTANSVELQGYIVGVADTLLTVAGDALTNHTFSEVFISKIANPQGFKHWFGYTPTVDGGTAKLSTYTAARFCVRGRCCRVHFEAENVTISGSAGAAQITLPISASTDAGSNFCPQATIYNASAYALVRMIIGGSSLTVLGDISTGNIATGAGRYIYFDIEYEI